MVRHRIVTLFILARRSFSSSGSSGTIRQVIRNWLSNAITFTLEGGRIIRQGRVRHSLARTGLGQIKMSSVRRKLRAYDNRGNDGSDAGGQRAKLAAPDQLTRTAIRSGDRRCRGLASDRGPSLGSVLTGGPAMPMYEYHCDRCESRASRMVAGPVFLTGTPRSW